MGEAAFEFPLEGPPDETFERIDRALDGERIPGRKGQSKPRYELTRGERGWLLRERGLYGAGGYLTLAARPDGMVLEFREPPRLVRPGLGRLIASAIGAVILVATGALLMWSAGLYPEGSEPWLRARLLALRDMFLAVCADLARAAPNDQTPKA